MHRRAMWLTPAFRVLVILRPNYIQQEGWRYSGKWLKLSQMVSGQDYVGAQPC